jgi:hypothetical protein
LSLSGPNSEEFIEPKVQEIWKKAEETNFSKNELQLLHVRKMINLNVSINGLSITYRTFRMN